MVRWYLEMVPGETIMIIEDGTWRNYPGNGKIVPGETILIIEDCTLRNSPGYPSSPTTLSKE